MPKEKYKNISDIPFHVFSNKECTMTPSKELREYLRYMYDNHRDDLDYLYRYVQQYTLHGGCYQIIWSRWLSRLDKDLKAQEAE